MSEILKNYTFPIDKYIKKAITVRMPISLYSNEGIQKLNSAIKSKQPYKLYQFYRDLKENYNIEAFNYLSNSFNKTRFVSDSDKKLIFAFINIQGNLKNTLQYNNHSVFFEMVGNLFYISKLADKVNEESNKEKNDTVIISLYLWIYLNLVELLTKYFSDLIKFGYYKNKSNSKKTQEFFSKFKDGEHPTLGKLKNVILSENIVNNLEDSIITNNIRNKIAHANIYYDENEKKLFFTSGKEFSVCELKNEIEKLNDFLIEYLNCFNNEKDIKETFLNLCGTLSREFLKIERAGNLKKRFGEILLEIEKE